MLGNSVTPVAVMRTGTCRIGGGEPRSDRPPTRQSRLGLPPRRFAQLVAASCWQALRRGGPTIMYWANYWATHHLCALVARLPPPVTLSSPSRSYYLRTCCTSNPEPTSHLQTPSPEPPPKQPPNHHNDLPLSAVHNPPRSSPLLYGTYVAPSYLVHPLARAALPHRPPLRCRHYSFPHPLHHVPNMCRRAACTDATHLRRCLATGTMDLCARLDASDAFATGMVSCRTHISQTPPRIQGSGGVTSRMARNDCKPRLVAQNHPPASPSQHILHSSKYGVSLMMADVCEAVSWRLQARSRPGPLFSRPQLVFCRSIACRTLLPLGGNGDV